MNEFFDNLFIGDKDDLLLQMITNLKKNKKAFIVTANPETFMNGLNDDDIRYILTNKKNCIVSDGIGIIKGCKILGKKVPNKITGISLVDDFLKIANQHEAKVFFFGSKSNVLESLKNEVNIKYPKVVITGLINGYDYDEELVVKKIQKEKPDFIFVALGIPKQEKFINRYYNQFSKGIFMGVGGSLDVLSGNKKRAPKLFRKLNIEWLYRIMKEPKRIRRFYQNNIKFIWKIKR